MSFLRAKRGDAPTPFLAGQCQTPKKPRSGRRYDRSFRFRVSPLAADIGGQVAGAARIYAVYRERADSPRALRLTIATTPMMRPATMPTEFSRIAESAAFFMMP